MPDPTCPRCGFSGPPSRTYEDQGLIKCGGCEQLVEPAKAAPEESPKVPAAPPLRAALAVTCPEDGALDVGVVEGTAGGVEIRLTVPPRLRFMVLVTTAIAVVLGIQAGRTYGFHPVVGFMVAIVAYKLLAWSLGRTSLVVDRRGVRRSFGPLPDLEMMGTRSFSLDEVAVVDVQERSSSGYQNRGGQPYWYLVVEHPDETVTPLATHRLPEDQARWIAARLQVALEAQKR